MCLVKEKIELQSEYWGETGRNCFLRGKKTKMYKIKPECSFKKGSTRHVREEVELEMSKANQILNSKFEWNHSLKK